MDFLKTIPSSEQPDEELVMLFKQTRELQVLGNLYGRYMDMVYGVCLKYLKSQESAQDSVMAIFEELIIKLPKHDVNHFKNWLYSVARNHCLMELRSGKKKRVVAIEEELMQFEADEHPDGVLSKEEDLKKLEGCLELLGGEQKKAITLFYLDGKCYNEIADITGIEWNKVRSFIQNGRRNLKNCMEQQTVKQAIQK